MEDGDSEGIISTTRIDLERDWTPNRSKRKVRTTSLRLNFAHSPEFQRLGYNAPWYFKPFHPILVLRSSYKLCKRIWLQWCHKHHELKPRKRNARRSAYGSEFLQESCQPFMTFFSLLMCAHAFLSLAITGKHVLQS